VDEESEDVHITEAYLVQLADKRQELSEDDIAHISECEECDQALTQFLKRYIKPQ